MKTQTAAATTALEFLNALQQHNRPAVITLLHSALQWEQPGNNRLSGFKKSAEEALQMGTDMAELTNATCHLADFELLAAEEETAVCMLRWTGTNLAGEKLDVVNIDVYNITAGQIIHGKVYTADQAQEDAFWR